MTECVIIARGSAGSHPTITVGWVHVGSFILGELTIPLCSLIIIYHLLQIT